MISQSQRVTFSFTMIFIYFYGSLCYALAGFNTALLGGVFVLIGLILGNLFRESQILRKQNQINNDGVMANPSPKKPIANEN